MVGLSSLNMNNPMVTVMENEFEQVRRLLLDYTKLHIKSLIILNICNVILCLSLLNIPMLIVTEILINSYCNKTIKELHKECNLKKVGKILFGEENNYDIYDINESDVYNTTRMLSEMIGKASRNINILKAIDTLYIIMASLSLLNTIVIIVIKLLWR